MVVWMTRLGLGCLVILKSKVPKTDQKLFVLGKGMWSMNFAVR